MTVMVTSISKARLRPYLKGFTRDVLVTSKGPPLNAIKVGLCVSGGPDSMALATLFASLDGDDLGFDIEPVGLIVDHSARPGSSDEAKAVSEQLEKIGIPSHIRRVNWGINNPMSMTNFESQARTRRYHELTLAAMDSGIRHLFLGHHRDDQMETVLLRLIRSRGPSFLNLKGMEADSSVPASHSIFGARQELQALPMKKLLRSLESNASPGKLCKEVATRTNTRLTVNTRVGKIRTFMPGGIQIHRPLLEFSKADLIATCTEQHIPYITDKTNVDPQFTARNAIRFLRGRELPRALQVTSLMRLIVSSRSHTIKLQDRVSGCLRCVSLIALDLQAAVALIGVPRSFEQYAVKDKPAAAGVLAKLCQLVTPVTTDDARTLEEEEKLDVFLYYLRHGFWRSGGKGKGPSFSCSKVQFEGISSESYTGDLTYWRLSRQPMHKEEVLRNRLDASKLTVRKYEDSSRREYVSECILWDNRFWIQITTSDKSLFDHMVVRPFCASDWGPWSKQFPKQVTRTYRGMMNNHAPGKIRYTLPIIEFQNSIIAFPTLTDQILETRALQRWMKDHGHKDTPRIVWEVNFKVLPRSIIDWAASMGKSVHFESN